MVPPSKDNSQPSDSPCNSTVVQSQSVKRLVNTQVQSTPEALGEGLHSDSDHNWTHLKKPTNGVNVGTVAIHAPTATNSESSITKPTFEDSKGKKT